LKRNTETVNENNQCRNR